MPLHILGLLVVAGLGVVLLAVHYGGNTNSDALTEAKAKSRFLRDFAWFKVGKVVVSDDQQCAVLLNSKEQTCGLVYSIGKNQITRLVDASLIKEIRSTSKGLELSLRDFTLRKVEINLADAEKREALKSSLEDIMKA